VKTATEMGNEDYVSSRRRRDMWRFDALANASLEEKRQFIAACDPRKFMTASERRKLVALPDEFTVWRGFQGKRRDGLSWSLSRRVAEMFTRLRDDLPRGIVIERRVKKSEVFAYIEGDEAEIIIL